MSEIKQEKPDITANYSTAEKLTSSGEKNPAYKDRSETITEEVKVHVASMYHKGRSISEIARAFDLTKTEVELIAATRKRKMDQIINETTSESENYTDTDYFYQAITELKSNGCSYREIAQKLQISTSEVQMAFKIMEMLKKN